MSSEPIVTEPIVTEPIVVSNEASSVNVDNVDLKASLKAEIKAELKAELNESQAAIPTPVVESQPVESASETTSCLDVVGNMLKKETEPVAPVVVDTNAKNDVESVPEVVEKVAEKPFVSSLATILTVCGKALQKDIHVTSDNLIVILHSIMEAIESLKLVKTLPALSSGQKKQLCIDCLKWLVNHQSDLSDNEKAALLILVESIAPNAIDIIISVSNGASELVLMTVKRIAPCFPCENKCCVM